MKKINNEKAFTLIEVLLYTIIFAIVGGLTTGILLTVTQVQQRESASAEVTGQLNFVMQRIQQLVRESSNIEIPTSTAISTILKLRMQDDAKDPIYISLSGNAIQLKEGSSATTTLTSDKVIVNTLNFKKFTQYPGHDTVSLDITMTYNSQNPKSQVQRTLSSAIARVSAATFDSNLLPGATSYYTVGQSGSAWQTVFVGDGSASSPSYSFGSDTNVGIFRPDADILGFTTNSSERMRIDASGNVGIGTTAMEPATKLTVNGNIAASAIWGPAANGRLDIYGDYGAATGVTILDTGNVGIGTTGPQRKLDINNGLTSAGNGSVRVYGYQAGFEVYNAAGTSNWYFANNDADSDKLYIGQGYGPNQGIAPYLVINKASGNVGIGTTVPGTNKLEVVGGPIKATGGLIIETRTSDPASPVAGQIWLRTDL